MYAGGGADDAAKPAGGSAGQTTITAACAARRARMLRMLPALQLRTPAQGKPPCLNVHYCSAQPKSATLEKVIYKAASRAGLFLDQELCWVHQARLSKMRLLTSFPNLPLTLKQVEVFENLRSRF